MFFARPLLILWLTAAAVAASGPLASDAVAVLEKRCLQCHSEKMSMAGFSVTSREALLKGGGRGPALVPGKPADSRLIQILAHSEKLAMPPTGKLDAAEIDLLTRWVAAGAEWPERKVAAKQTNWWAFRKPVRPAVPKVEGGVNPIDAFLLDRLQRDGIEPAPRAERRTLLQRAVADLHGLPATADQVRAFLADSSPDAWPRLVDQLLESKHYGEQWGRHWLDLVRYGDTSGFEQDPYNLEAWRFRDYVIRSFNDDKPYDRFIKEQLAGDEIWPDDPEARTGTGYYRVGTNRDMLFKVEDLNRVEKLTDYVDTTSTVLLGLTVGCARCHDHKFDPIPQRDFYRMQAIFAPVVNERVFLDYNPARFYDIAQNTREFKLRQIAETIDRIQKPYKNTLRQERISKLPEDVQALFRIPADDRTPEQQAVVTANDEAVRVSSDEVYAALPAADAERLHTVERKLVGLFAGYGPPPMAPGVIDIGREAPRTYIAMRGNPDSPGEEVGPGFLAVLGGGDVPEAPEHARTTFRRKALAEWLTSPDNPLFARVMVNRIWQFHFGAPLLATPSDFGTRAQTPAYPELLDWLATEFVRQNYSIKAMHRLIMTSEAYRRSSNPTPAAREKDPSNQLFSRANRRRLSAEEIRDAVLLASGSLNEKMYGMPVVPPLAEEELYGIIGKPDSAWVVTADAEEHFRRSIYLLSRRTFRQPMFEAFDKPDGVLSCSRRNESTTAPQSLTLLNGRFMVEQARLLASKMTSIEDAWSRVLGRDPDADEKRSAAEFLGRQERLLGSRDAARTELARALLNLNEFLYVD